MSFAFLLLGTRGFLFFPIPNGRTTCTWRGHFGRPPQRTCSLVMRQCRWLLGVRSIQLNRPQRSRNWRNRRTSGDRIRAGCGRDEIQLSCSNVGAELQGASPVCHLREFDEGAISGGTPGPDKVSGQKTSGGQIVMPPIPDGFGKNTPTALNPGHWSLTLTGDPRPLISEYGKQVCK